eukprot:scaffold25095_cov51-Attheya_sp.AAC.1
MSSGNAHKSASAGGLGVDKFARFDNWLRDNGARFDQLELREYGEAASTKSAQRFERAESDSGEEKKEPNKEGGAYDDDIDQDDSMADEADSEMRGVHAKTNIPSNTICVAVPRRCLITVDMGQATDIGRAILSADLDLDAPKHIFLMIYLLWDRKVNGDKSFFKPYYDILPPTLSNMPIFWSEEELSFLTGSYLLTQIADRNEAITDDYLAICEIAPELAQIATLDDFKWARMCVCSRNFGLQIDGHRTSALVPHADMLNHFRPRETKWTFDDEIQCFTITTLQSISAGEQVYDSYGQKCNHRFLLNYGFAVEDNHEIDGFCPNEVPIELGVFPDDPLFEAKYEFWTRGDANSHGSGVSALAAAVAAAGAARAEQPHASNHDSARAIVAAVEAAAAAAVSGGSDRMSDTVMGSVPMSSLKRVRVSVSNNENSRVLFSMLRVLACNEAELQDLAGSTSEDSGAGFISRAMLGLPVSGSGGSLSLSSSAFYRTCRDIRHPLNIRNEKTAMTHLLAVVKRGLNLYPISLAQDMADLLDEISFPRFSNKRHAKIQVRGEKEVLHHFAIWAQTALEVMDVIEQDLEEERKKIARGIADSEYSATSARHYSVSNNGKPGFDQLVREMEDDEAMDGQSARHHTIVRYCADVLGNLRREEIKNLRKTRRLSTGGNTGYTASPQRPIGNNGRYV